MKRIFESVVITEHTEPFNSKHQLIYSLLNLKNEKGIVSFFSIFSFH